MTARRARNRRTKFEPKTAFLTRLDTTSNLPAKDRSHRKQDFHHPVSEEIEDSSVDYYLMYREKDYIVTKALISARLVLAPSAEDIVLRDIRSQRARLAFRRGSP